MTLWIIEPQDPLIVRDGRPFHATPGARARSLPFPFPSTTAGGVRTRAGQGANGLFDTSKIDAVKKISVRGPLLVEQNKEGGWNFLVPAPADALVFDEKINEGSDTPDTNNKKIECKWLRPLTCTNVQSDKPSELKYLVGLPAPDSRKPSKNAPAFWKWKKFAEWLTNPDANKIPIPPAELGHNGPQPDRRIHVGINPETFTSLDGALFATSGLTFWQRAEGNGLEGTQKLALAVEVDDSDVADLGIDEGFAPLGGERRLMGWKKQGNSFPDDVQDTLAKTIKKNGGYCRLILLTPAYFEKEGWRPDFSEEVELLAAAVSSPIVVSGWDFASKPPGPKPTKRLAPAGSVYFVKVEGDVEQWVKDRWMQPLLDDEMGKAGFGLTVVGVWDGNAKELVINKEESDG